MLATNTVNASNATADFPFIPFNAEGGNQSRGRGAPNAANTNTTAYVFLYYTQSGGGKNGDDHPNNCDCNYKNGGGVHPKSGVKPIQPLGNRLYRYEFDEHNNKLNKSQIVVRPSCYNV